MVIISIKMMTKMMPMKMAMAKVMTMIIRIRTKMILMKMAMAKVMTIEIVFGNN